MLTNSVDRDQIAWMRRLYADRICQKVDFIWKHSCITALHYNHQNRNEELCVDEAC